jgi:rhodanese-related sulfurtransferase
MHLLNKTGFEPICFQVLWQFGIIAAKPRLPAPPIPSRAPRGEDRIPFELSLKYTAKSSFCVENGKIKNMAKVITTEELKNRIDQGGSFHLVDVLSANSYEAKHLPGAKNVPNGPGFAEEFRKKIGAPKDAEIIVYCASATCVASVQAADALEKAGYTHVLHYKDGLAGWQDAGFKFES